MKQSLFITIVLVVGAGISYLIFEFLFPPYIQAGGITMVILLTLSIMVFTFVLERFFSLKRAEGNGSLDAFRKHVEAALWENDIDRAIKLCEDQRGAVASVLQSGLARFNEVRKDPKFSVDRQIRELQRIIQEQTALQMPMLEKNLPALSTIASVATMFGLLGTVTGMIRAFQAMAQTGAPDAVKLSSGISEALVTTAGGLIVGIAALVAYNFFATKVDNFTYALDETVFDVVQTLTVQREE
jgi:biopolymer transport protein ExbB